VCLSPGKKKTERREAKRVFKTGCWIFVLEKEGTAVCTRGGAKKKRGMSTPESTPLFTDHSKTKAWEKGKKRRRKGPAQGENNEGQK